MGAVQAVQGPPLVAAAATLPPLKGAALWELLPGQQLKKQLLGMRTPYSNARLTVNAAPIKLAGVVGTVQGQGLLVYTVEPAQVRVGNT